MNGIPHYPSLMNYAYNYQLGGRGDAIDYSRGALAHLALDERALPERIGVSATAVAYLAGPPFHFRVEPRDGGGACWIDWDRDAVEDGGPVRANINAASGEGYGPRYILDQMSKLPGVETRTTQEPLLVAVPGPISGTSSPEQPEPRRGPPDERLALLWVPRATGGLAVRILSEDDPAKFSRPRMLSVRKDLACIAAAAHGRTVSVFGTSEGAVVELRGTLEGEGAWQDLGQIRGTAGSVPGATSGPDATYLILRAPDGELSARWRPAGGGPCDWSEPRALGVRSSVPPGAAFDTVKGEVLVGTADPGTHRMRLHRLDPVSLEVRKSEQVGGPKAGDATTRRPSVLFATAPWLPPEGEVSIYVAGASDYSRPDAWGHMFRCYTIGDKQWLGREGWKCDQTWNEWTYTQSGVSAAWFEGRPWHAGRFYTFPFWDPEGWKDAIAIGPNADGICDSGLRDWNDWEIITSIGLERSILNAWTPRGKR